MNMHYWYTLTFVGIAKYRIYRKVQRLLSNVKALLSFAAHSTEIKSSGLNSTGGVA